METIEDIVSDIRHVSELHGMKFKQDERWHIAAHEYTRIIADRIEAAHKAEITAKDATIAHHEAINEQQDIDNSRLNATIARLTEALKSIAQRTSEFEITSGIYATAREALAVAEGGEK